MKITNVDFRKLVFNEPGGTSRGVLYQKPSWFITIEDHDGIAGVGECSIIPNLSRDDEQWLATHLNSDLDLNAVNLPHVPAFQFAIESAKQAIEFKKNHPTSEYEPHRLYLNEFTIGQRGIQINGLIWMGDRDKMKDRIAEKLKNGFRCLKLKVGAIEFNHELELLKAIRQEFSVSDLELRLDANGAFDPSNALKKLSRLAEYNIHSIEQPIRSGQYDAMASLCESSPIPIALDEELIPHRNLSEKQQLLEIIRPQYVILKPSLLGGFTECQQWIDIANELEIGWWSTSALESNIGLNAIAQWVSTFELSLPQGLGTGQVFSNNIRSPLELKSDLLYINPNGTWGDI